jgi:sugar lactone lactonase YvrE
VPSSIAVGPDGALYVGELTGVPFAPGSARVWRVRPGERPIVFATGFTTIADLAFDGRNLLVLELSTKGLLSGKSAGALIRVTPRRAKTVVAQKGLLYPTGVAVDGDSIYISNNGLYPASGAGPHGEVVRLSTG